MAGRWYIPSGRAHCRSRWVVYGQSKGHLFQTHFLGAGEGEDGKEYCMQLGTWQGLQGLEEGDRWESSDAAGGEGTRKIPEILIGRSRVSPTPSTAESLTCIHPTPVTMMAPMSPFQPGLSRRDTARAAAAAHEHPPSIPPPFAGPGAAPGPQSAGSIYKHIHDMCTKRISTLDYLRKA